ncbi:methylated-DNA--[protein]-cysteine S-methyltransferase [Ferroacidibacillus organovorans]|uniref:Methylated-DNA--protein-cysteine methyltransferase n=1 Tax=Ferroacidibacillus organovorans TaxID=1765683 RepID=A0A101XRT6_9BACL|nr:methylated-DNA--[protein]-cysteine S-methyltransferase [Ferroacidibacillus organovorans]KUO96345.1 cysteine methyltransferase [Ferroacidibacillus organovorans]
MEQTSSTVYWATFEHENWKFHLGATDHGLCTILFSDETYENLERWVKKSIPGAILKADETKLLPYIDEIRDYLCGRLQVFSSPLDLRGTPFQVQVWRALQQIPYGQTRSYSEIAANVGRKNAVRAVGAANGANPLPIMIPCHRVIGKNGTLTGYSGGLDIKVRLLKLEGHLQWAL